MNARVQSDVEYILECMAPVFTIIDSFRVTPELQARLGELQIGIWYVLDGGFQALSDLPPVGSTVSVATPYGSTLEASILDCQLRHGAAALLLSGDGSESLPRLSTVTLATNAL
jgi:hypothetical protein